jgi:hypothetical protein
VALDCRKRILPALKLNTSRVRSRTFRELNCRLNKRFILILPILLIGSIFVGSTVIPKAHALTGTVCITASATATSCPASAPAIGPITAGQNFTVGVFVSGSDAMGGFDIYVQNDQAFLNPRVAALGTLIVTPSLTSICVNGAASTGSCTTNSANGPGVVEVTTIESSGGNECGSIGPCSGMAFTITYTAVAATPSTSFSYPINPACSNSSVSSPLNVCVLVADAFGTALSESIQAATVSVQAAAVLSLVSVVKGTDNNLYFNTFIGAWGGTWQPLNGQTPSSPSLCQSGPTSTELVIRGTDNGIYHKTFSVSNSSFRTIWDKNPTGLTNNQPVCAVIGTTLYVVVIGNTGELWSTTFDLSARTWAASWTDLLGTTASPPALAATPSISRLDLVVRGTNNLIYHKAFTSGAWATAWDTSNRSPVPDKTIGTPAIVSDGSQLHIVVIGTEGNLWYATLSFTGVWSTYQSLVGSTSAIPVLVIDSAGTLHLVVTGTSGAVYEKAHPSGGSWDPTWTNAGGIVSGTPAVTTIGSTVHIVVKGFDARLWYNTFSGGTFSGYVSMNGAAALSPSLSTP